MQNFCMPSDFVLKLWVFTSSQPVELSIVINFKFPLFWVAQHVAKQKGAVQIAFEGEKHQVVDFPRGGGGGITTWDESKLLIQ